MLAPAAAAHGWRCSITTRRVATTVGNREHGELGATLCGSRVGRDGENGKWGWPSLRSFTKDNEGSMHVGRQYQGRRRSESDTAVRRRRPKRATGQQPRRKRARSVGFGHVG
jgi:hypothetical protein